jgi:hypothetical protein
LKGYWSTEVILKALDVLGVLAINMTIENQNFRNCAKELTIFLCRTIDVFLKGEELVVCYS